MGYKIVVIGAGPGGTVLARELALQGLDVSIFEKGRFDQLGHDWSDAVERSALEAAGLEMPTLEGLQWRGEPVKDFPGDQGVFEKHAVPRLQMFSPGLQSCKEVEFKMITTDRRRLGKMLVEQAASTGARVYYRHEGEGLLFRETGKKGPAGAEVLGAVIRDLDSGVKKEVEADLVVESCGFSPLLRKSLPAYTGLAGGFNDRDFALVHREVRRFDPEDPANPAVPDHYRYGFNRGYQWSHIHNEERIDVGAGVRYDPDGPDPRNIIEEFIARHPAIKPERLRGGRSLCIVGPPLDNFVCPGFLVIGDAASTSVPTTGCGVGSSILIALWAAEVIAGAARENRNDLDKLWEINKKFYRESERGPAFQALASLRMMLQELSHEEIDYLFTADLLDASTLQDAVNGIFRPPAAGKKFRSFLSGVARPRVLLSLSRALAGAERIYDHYQNYPAVWHADEFAKWQTEANKLTGR